MHILIAAFVVSLLVTLAAIRWSKTRGGRTLDHDVTGPQKFHARPVARIGGVGIFAGTLCAAVLLWLAAPSYGRLALLLLLCSLPAFGSGLLEDLTKSQSPRRRLFFTAVSAALAIVVVNGVIERTAIPGLDWVVSTSIGAAAVTILAVAGVANSLNIIDGFNGLASMCAFLILASIGYVAFQAGDPVVMWLAIAGSGAVLGFFVWNFPLGLIFLGDGGAYFLGFYVAEVAILLLQRNPSVSPMFPLLVCIYPVFETLFSIYRRSWLRGKPPGMPDGIHLHSLIYRRIMRWAVGDRSAKALTQRNSMTSPYLWALCMLSVIPAMLFWSNTVVLAVCLVVFGVTYVVLYWRIVRFKAPRLLRTLGSRPMPLTPRDEDS